MARLLGPDGRLLLGTDLVKDVGVLEAAYDDSRGRHRGVQPQRAARDEPRAGADFEPEAFEHVAFFDREREWIEMRLRARRRSRCVFGALGLDVAFAAGEELRTEISAKFTPERLARRPRRGGPAPVAAFRDPAGWFQLTLARAA